MNGRSPSRGPCGVWPSLPEVPTLASLAVIVGILALATTTSILANRRDERPGSRGPDAGATAPSVGEAEAAEVSAR